MMKKATVSADPVMATETTSLIQADKNSQEEKSKRNIKTPSLLRVLARTFGWTLLKSHMCKFSYDIVQFASPLILK